MTTDNAEQARFRLVALPWTGHYEIRDYAYPSDRLPYTVGYFYGGRGAQEVAEKDCARLNSGEEKPPMSWYGGPSDRPAYWRIMARYDLRCLGTTTDEAEAQRHREAGHRVIEVGHVTLWHD